MPATLLAVVAVAVAVAAGCGTSSSDQQLLAQFFQASRIRDNASLAAVATVSFDPRTNGSVQDFTVVRVAPEERHPLSSPAERELARNSLDEPELPDVDVNGAAVELITRQVTITARVRDPLGQSAPRTLVFTMHRAVVLGDGKTREGRRLITGFK